LDAVAYLPGTDGSNPLPSSRESDELRYVGDLTAKRRRIARFFLFSGVQQRRFCRRALKNSRRGIIDTRPLSRRQHCGRAGITFLSRILPRRLLAGRSGAPFSPSEWKLASVS